ncbi:MAG: DUF2723 domain-containing protein [Saprospiraceae bacterium]
MNFKRITNIAGWIVFTIAFIVYYLSVERTGSLWDCGEFIAGAYKLQVVHPPGAPIFLIVGRMFTWVAELISDDPQDIAFAVNLSSGVYSAFTAMFVAWCTIMLGKLALLGRVKVPDSAEALALAGAGVAAGLATAFSSSIWFSAVEGEVYAMSTFFTALTLWAMIKWYYLPDTPKTDRWLIFAVFAAGLSIGVHLLSLLTFPALALFYYFKKFRDHSWLGMGIAAAVGVLSISVIQLFVIIGIPTLWSKMELLTVNGMGLPPHSGLIPVVIIIGSAIFFGLRYAHKTQNATLQKIIVGLSLVVVAFSTIGVVVIRANANTPINMNAPSDVMRLIPYLNREQYGERPFLYGPWYGAKPRKTETTPRYGLVGDRYEIVDQKIEYVFDSKDKMLLPRMGDYTQSRPQLYDREWRAKGKTGKPSQLENIGFLLRYQIGHMYFRYFMWNFAGRQNGEQGYHPNDVKSGNWLSGIPFVDSARLYNQSQLPTSMVEHKARNKYYFLPIIFGLIGIFFHFRKSRKDALGLLALFIITGIGIIIYSNQPPHEPRERDYVLIGSFFTFCIWIGMGVLALFEIFRSKMNTSIAAPLAVALVMLAPVVMGFQNFDDHTRRHHTGSRDYATNFLNSCAPNAIIFTYGDNDTYPLWYAQEVEKIRTDVRVVNLSLIAVDWYIDQLRRKVNDSEAIKMTIPRTAYRGKKRNQIPFIIQEGSEARRMALGDAVKHLATDFSTQLRGQLETYLPARKFYIPVDKQQAINSGAVSIKDTANIVDRINFGYGGGKSQLLKGDIAVLDIIQSNLWERPIYFAVTCREESLQGLGSYLRLEGLGSRLVPLRPNKSPEQARQDRQYGLVGMGSVDTDKVKENIIDKFRWGNFDKEHLFVDRSYAPSVQMQTLVFLRTAKAMVEKGDKQGAIDLMDQYFEAFPHMNFQYDNITFQMMLNYVNAGAYEKAKPHLKILANEVMEHLYFFTSIDDNARAAFQRDIALMMQNKDNIMRLVKQQKDTELEKEFNEMFIDFQDPSQVPLPN